MATINPVTPAVKPSFRNRLLATAGIGAIGGVFFGVPLYLTIKNWDTISRTLKDKFETVKDHAKFRMFDTPLPIKAAPVQLPPTDFKILLRKLRAKPAAAAAAAVFAVASLGGAYALNEGLKTGTSPNFDRAARYGAIGLGWNAHKQASLDAQKGVRGYWTSLGNRLLFKGGDLSEGTVTAANNVSGTVRDLSAVFADPDTEGSKIFGKSEALKGKKIQVCLDLTDASEQRKDAETGELQWFKKEDAQTEENKAKQRAFFEKVNTYAEGLKSSPNSTLYAALAKASQATIIIPGYKSDKGPSVTTDETCAGPKYLSLSGNADEWVKGQGYKANLTPSYKLK